MQRKTRAGVAPAAPGVTARALALLCVAVGIAGQAGFMAFVLLLGLDWLPPREPLPGAWPWAVNLGWLAAFGVQHSGMARAGFKRAWSRVVGPQLERAVYVAVSGLVLTGLSLTWQPLPGEPLWRLPPWFVGVALLGALGLTAVCGLFDPLRFLGLRQAWGEDGAASERLIVTGPYRYVRHPLMTCTLLFLWGQPVLSPALALLSGGLTAYILLALRLEERELVRQFGAEYEGYRRRVPALIPWRPPLAGPRA